MESPAQESIRKENYSILRRIRHAIHPQHHPELDFVDPTMMSTLPITLSELPLDAESIIDLDPRYSKLFSKSEMDRSFENLWGPSGVDFRWPQTCPATVNFHQGYDLMLFLSRKLYEDLFYDPANARGIRPPPRFHGSLLDQSAWTDASLRIGSYDRSCLQYGTWIRDQHNVFWETDFLILAHSAGTMPNPRKGQPAPKPHLGAFLSHGVPFEHGILRSELLCIAALMSKRMKVPEWSHYRLFPVFIYTFNGSMARVTQAVFENQRLRIRQTKALDISCPNNDFENIKLLLRWILAEPCGDTLWELEEVQDRTAEAPETPILRPKVTLSVQ